jgi:hypothetical protein
MAADPPAIEFSRFNRMQGYCNFFLATLLNLTPFYILSTKNDNKKRKMANLFE